MNPERWEQVAELHRAALERDESGRAAFLREACAGDEDLRQEVESLVGYEEDGMGFLESPALEAAARVFAGDEAPSSPRHAGDPTSGAEDAGQRTFTLLAGTRLGRYEVVRFLGSGGMGQVYLAEQTAPVRRQVALKVIKAGVFDDLSLRRFESERQALAIMDHPAIAKVFDAGATPEGQPFLAMEYVPGQPITRYCDEEKLDVPQRLDLFIKVCDGVQHAHQKAIIHRDLKPANILIVEVDGKPQPRIIDFGIAKAALPQPADATLLTREGSMVGTPGYMSPEQAEPGTEDVDTRADVYALGATLYELLTGSLPFDPKQWRQKPWHQILRQLREDDPPRPSTKVSLEKGTSATNAGMRGTGPRQLVSLLRGDLDSITMKALEKDRARRYGTPSELGADLGRYLRNEPVIAAPASQGYILKKYIRRHRIAFVVSAGLALLLAGFSVVQAIQIRRITRERDRASRISQFMTDMFRDTDPSVTNGKTVTAREMLDSASKEIDSGLAGDPELQADLMYTMGDVYQNIGLYPQSQALLERSLAIRRRVLGPDNPDTLESWQDLGETLSYGGHSREGEQIYRQVLEARRRVLGADSPATLRTMFCLAEVTSTPDRFPEAEKLYRQTLQIQRRVLGPENEKTLVTMDALAGLLTSEKRYPEAEKLLRQTADVRRRTQSADGFTGENSLALVMFAEGRYPEAEKLFREAVDLRRQRLGPDQPRTLNVMYNLALTLETEGRYSEAEQVARPTFDARRRVFGPDHPDTLWSMDLLGGALAGEGRYVEAENTLREAVAIGRRALGPSDSRTANFTYDLAAATLGNVREPARRDKALTLLRQAVDHGLDRPACLGMHQDPLLKPLYGDPRFEALAAHAQQLGSTQTSN